MKREQITSRRQMIATITLLLMTAFIGCERHLHGQNAAGQGAQPNPVAAAEPLLVRLLRESNPASAFELTRAAKLLGDTGHFKEAKKYLQQLLALKLNPQQQAALQRDFGADLFLRFSREPELQPEGAQISNMISATAFRLANDPTYIAGLIDKLSDPSAEVRFTAMQDLKLGGTTAVIALADRLGDDQRAAEQPAIRAALLQFRAIAQEPLIGYLVTTDDHNNKSPKPPVAQQIEVIHLLGKMDHARSIMYLVPLAILGEENAPLRKSAQLALQRMTGTVPSQREAEVYLSRQLKEFAQGGVPVPIETDETDNFITLWQWDPQKKTTVPRRWHPEIAAVELAAQTAKYLYDLDPQNREYNLSYWIHMLTACKRKGDINSTLPPAKIKAAEKAGAVLMHDVYRQALEADQIAAAVAAAEILGKIGSPKLLQTGTGQLSPLVKGLFHSNRWLRFSVMETILYLDPQQPFPGSSHVTDALGFFAFTEGKPTAFVGHPLLVRRQFLTGLLNQAGYQAGNATGGKKFLELVRKQSDCDLVLISNTISSPTIGELIQRFRDDPRTASISIGILASPDNLERVRLLASMDSLTEVVGRPHNVENLAFFLARLEQRKAYHHVGPKNRIIQARKALQWLDKLTANLDLYGFYHLWRIESAVVNAVSVSRLTSYAAPVLGSLGTAKAQRALVNTASRNALSLTQRQAAAGAFNRALENRRLLLTREEILRQYDRYNATRNLDRQTQLVLESILNSIEKRMLLESTPEKTKDGT